MRSAERGAAPRKERSLRVEGKGVWGNVGGWLWLARQAGWGGRAAA